MSSLGGNVDVVSRLHVDRLSIVLEHQLAFSLQHDHPFVFVLIVPRVTGTAVSCGNYTFDADVLVLGNNLGNLTDLGTFLFDQERSSLEAYNNILIDVQERKCFYCLKDLQQNMDVDHFIPWSRYPTDLGHNFVLAHPRCNSSKSDYLAAEQHLQSWSERNHTHSHELAERLRDAGLPSDSSASLRITEWAYEQVERANGQVWLNDAVFQHLGAGWRELLVA